MNTKLFKLLTAGAFALLSACGDNSIEAGNDNAPVQTTATLNVLVKDAITNASLKASVKLSTGASDSTNASGFVYFKGVPAGDHRALIEKTGYASVVIEPHINSSLIENIYIATDATISAGLYPRTSGLEGYVLFEDKNGSSKPPTSATVRFIASTALNLVDNVFEVPVSSTNGKFTFDSLPAIGNSYTLQVLDAATDGQKYTAKSYAGTALVKGTTVSLTSSIKYTAADLTDLFELTSFNSIIKSTDTLHLIFSDSIDVAKFKPDMITFSSNAIVAEKKIDGKQVRLIQSGNWPSSFTFTISNIQSVKGMVYSAAAKTVNLEGTFALARYNTYVKNTDTLVLEFSDSIDVTKFKPNMITFGNNVTTAVEKIANGKTLKLVPTKWPESSFVVFLNSDIESVKGLKLGSTSPITVNVEGFDIINVSNNIAAADTAVLEFSDDIDTNGISSKVYLTNNNVTLYPNIKVDGKKLKLTLKSGRWTGNSSYTVNFYNELKSLSGVIYAGSSETFSVKGSFNLVTYTDTLDLTDLTAPLIFEFSDSISEAQIKPTTVLFDNLSPIISITRTVVDGKKLKLELAEGNEWPSSSFTVTFNSTAASVLKSVNNITFSGQKTVYMRYPDLSNVQVAELGIVKLDGMTPDTLNYNSISTYLTWKKVAGVADVRVTNLTDYVAVTGGYRIYKKEGTGQFKLLTATDVIETPSGTGADTTMRFAMVSIANNLADGKSVEFLVQAVNSTSETKLIGANALTVKDTKKPIISGGYITPQSAVSGDTLYNWAGNVPNITSCSGDVNYDCEDGNWSGVRDEFKFDKLTQMNFVSYEYYTSEVLLNSKYYNTYITFNEPMDTNAVEIKYNGTKPVRFNIEKGWNTTGTRLYLNPVIAAGTVDNTNVSFTAHIANLKDRAGNDINVSYTISGTTVTKNNIGFKFTPLKNSNLP